MGLEQLIKNVKNDDLVIELLKGYMRNKQNCIITGQAGVGKTTLLKSLIGEINEKLAIKYCEYIPELNLEMIYPERNILKIYTPDYINKHKNFSILNCDAFVKYDVCSFVVDDLMSDDLIYYFIEDSFNYNIINLATHHATTTNALIESMINSYTNYYLLEIKKYFKDDFVLKYTDILDLIINFLNVNIHLKIYSDGVRRIERITEIIPIKNRNIKDFAMQNLIEINQEFENKTNVSNFFDSFICLDRVKYAEKENKYIISSIIK